jgi:hypothetical protein
LPKWQQLNNLLTYIVHFCALRNEDGGMINFCIMCVVNIYKGVNRGCGWRWVGTPPLETSMKLA